MRYVGFVASVSKIRKVSDLGRYNRQLKDLSKIGDTVWVDRAGGYMYIDPDRRRRFAP